MVTLQPISIVLLGETEGSYPGIRVRGIHRILYEQPNHCWNAATAAEYIRMVCSGAVKI